MNKKLILYINNSSQYIEIDLIDLVNLLKSEFKDTKNIKLFLKPSNIVISNLDNIQNELAKIWQSGLNHITILCKEYIMYSRGIYIEKKARIDIIKEGVITCQFSIETLNRCDI